jgi:hypothetical protein
MSDPGSSMSLTAVLVLAVVAIILLVGWLAVVFRAASQPAGRTARPGDEDAGHVAQQGAGLRGQAKPANAAHGADNPG